MRGRRKNYEISNLYYHKLSLQIKSAITRTIRRKEKKGSSKDGKAPGICKTWRTQEFIKNLKGSDGKKRRMVRGGGLARLNAGKGSKKKHPRAGCKWECREGERACLEKRGWARSGWTYGVRMRKTGTKPEDSCGLSLHTEKCRREAGCLQP